MNTSSLSASSLSSGSCESSCSSSRLSIAARRSVTLLSASLKSSGTSPVSASCLSLSTHFESMRLSTLVFIKAVSVSCGESEFKYSIYFCFLPEHKRIWIVVVSSSSEPDVIPQYIPHFRKELPEVVGCNDCVMTISQTSGASSRLRGHTRVPSGNISTGGSSYQNSLSERSPKASSNRRTASGAIR